MYEYNGYVYGGKPAESLKVINIKVLPDQMMVVEFSNGEKRLFDATILSGPVYEPLKNEIVFKTAKVDHGVVVWNNGEIDCAPEYMYDNSYEYASVS